MLSFLKELFDRRTEAQKWRENEFAIRKLLWLVLSNGLRCEANKILMARTPEAVVGRLPELSVTGAQSESPVLYLINGEWQQVDGPPAALFNDLLENVTPLFKYDGEPMPDSEFRKLFFEQIDLSIVAKYTTNSDFIEFDLLAPDSGGGGENP